MTLKYALKLAFAAIFFCLFAASSYGLEISYDMFEDGATISKELDDFNWDHARLDLMVRNTDGLLNVINTIPENLSYNSERLLRNFPFALIDYKFSSEDLYTFYSQFKWYRPNKYVSSNLNELTSNLKIFFSILKSGIYKNYKKSFNRIPTNTDQFFGLDLEVISPYAFLQDFNNIKVVNISDPVNPKTVTTIHDSSLGMVSGGENLFVITSNCINVYSVGRYNTINKVGSLSKSFGDVSDVVIYNDKLFICSDALYIFDVRNIKDLRFVSRYELKTAPPKPDKEQIYEFSSYKIKSIFINGNTGYIAGNGLWIGPYDTGDEPIVEIVDLAELTKPQYVGSLSQCGGRLPIISVNDGFLLGGDCLVDVRNPKKPRRVAKSDYSNWSYVLGGNNKFAVGIDGGKVNFYDIEHPYFPKQIAEKNIHSIYKSYENSRVIFEDRKIYLLANSKLYIFEMSN